MATTDMTMAMMVLLVMITNYTLRKLDVYFVVSSGNPPHFVRNPKSQKIPILAFFRNWKMKIEN